MPLPAFISAADAAQIANVTLPTIRRAIQVGQIPGRKIGREYRISLKAFCEAYDLAPDAVVAALAEAAS